MNNIKKMLAKVIYLFFRQYITFNAYRIPIKMAYACDVYIFDIKLATITYTDKELIEKKWL